MTPLALNGDKLNSLWSLRGLAKLSQHFNSVRLCIILARQNIKILEPEIPSIASVSLKICKMSSMANHVNKKLSKLKVQL